MTNAATNRSSPSALAKPLPTSIVSGILGLVFGGGLTFLGLHYGGYLTEQTPTAAAASTSGPSGMGGGGMGGGSMGGGGMGGGGMGGGGMGGGGMGGGGMGGGGMGGGGMGGGGMGGGGMGGGGGGGAPRGKRNLTTLVAKLDLASKGIPFRLHADQSTKLAEQLASLEQSEKMTQEEAQDRCDALQEMLSDEQKETLASFEMPRGGQGGGGPGGGGLGGGGPAPRGPGGGGPPPAGGGPGAGGGEPDDDNPFQEEANQARLHSLLDRLQGTPAGETSEPPSTPAE